MFEPAKFTRKAAEAAAEALARYLERLLNEEVNLDGLILGVEDSTGLLRVLITAAIDAAIRLGYLRRVEAPCDLLTKTGWVADAMTVPGVRRGRLVTKWDLDRLAGETLKALQTRHVEDRSEADRAQSSDEADRVQSSDEDAKAGEEATLVWDAATEARNRWLYAECVKGTPYDAIIRALGGRKRWERILTIQGIKKAANAYAKRHGLPPIPRRHAGRPKAEKRSGKRRRDTR
jgi:hypothetical protein